MAVGNLALVAVGKEGLIKGRMIVVAVRCKRLVGNPALMAVGNPALMAVNIASSL